MKKLIAICLLTGALWLPQTSNAQLGGGASVLPDNISASMLKLFGSTEGFTAESLTTLSSVKTSRETMTLPAKAAFLEGKMRTDIDLSQVKSADLPPEAMGQLKQMGMDTSYTIIRPDLKTMISVYPKLNVALEMPLSAAETRASDTNTKVDSTPIGPETVGSYQCTKNKVVITDASGTRQEMLVWNARELKDFPVKMEIISGDTKVVSEYRNIQMRKPEAGLFEVPAGITRYQNMQQFQGALMQKMMQQHGMP